MDITLSFTDPVSEACRKKLQTFSDSVLAQGITENQPPIIQFPGMNQETFFSIEKLWHAYVRRYGI